MTLEEIKNNLENFWKKYQVIKIDTWDMEMGAATFHPFCFFSVLENLPFKYMYTQPSRRYADGKYGNSPNRTLRHHQFQVIINPFTAIKNFSDVVIKSLEYLGFNSKNYDIRFFENNWENSGLGAFGVGWEVWINGMEVLQYTFFQKIADIDLNLTTVELAYGLERLCLIRNSLSSFMEISLDKNLFYKDLFFDFEKQMSKFYLENNNLIFDFENLTKTIKNSLENNYFFPAYELILQFHKNINLLIANRSITYEKRKELINSVRNLVNFCGICFLKSKNRNILL